MINYRASLSALVILTAITVLSIFCRPYWRKPTFLNLNLGGIQLGSSLEEVKTSFRESSDELYERNLNRPWQDTKVVASEVANVEITAKYGAAVITSSRLPLRSGTAILVSKNDTLEQVQRILGSSDLVVSVSTPSRPCQSIAGVELVVDGPNVDTKLLYPGWNLVIYGIRGHVTMITLARDLRDLTGSNDIRYARDYLR